MSRTIAAILASGLVLAGAATVWAQLKVIAGEHRTMTATIEAVDPILKRVTIRTRDGELRTLQIPEATRLSEIKPGDRVNATYYDNIVLRAKPASEPDIDTQDAARTVGTGGRPGGTVATQQTITAKVEAINSSEPSITLTGPRGWRYHSKVQDRAALAQLKVGDRVDITWTEATLVSVAAAK